MKKNLQSAKPPEKPTRKRLALDKRALAARKRTVGDRIRDLRNELWGMSLAEFAATIGYTHPSVNDWENAKRLPGAEALVALQESNQSADYLLGANVPRQLSARTEVGAIARELAAHIARKIPAKRYDHELAKLMGGAVPGTDPKALTDEQSAAAEVFLEVVVNWVRQCVRRLYAIRRTKDWDARDGLAGLLRQLRPDLPNVLDEWGQYDAAASEPEGGVSNVNDGVALPRRTLRDGKVVGRSTTRTRG